MDRKLLSNHGETITESLISVVIIAIAFVALQASVMASARVNAKANALIKNFEISNNPEQAQGYSVKVQHSDGNSDSVNVPVYWSKDNYYYYY